MNNSAEEFRNIFNDVARKGKLVKPRGQKVLEIENYSYELSPYVRFQNFKSRNLKLNYIRSEFLWYLKGDKFDTSIIEKAKMWKDLVNADGSINSNYGAYVFTNGQFDSVVKTLLDDKDSRRGSIMILSDSHLLSETKDVPCTYAINFRIRDDKLNMTVRMRSQDCVFGMANDAPAFSFIQEMMLNVLKTKYSNLECGNYHHSADSFHIYERHFELMEKIASGDEYTEIDCPRIKDTVEVSFIRNMDFSVIPQDYAYAKWLNVV